MYNGKVLLVTGGTGSFGNAVVKRYLNSTDVKEIRILSRDEKKQDDMRRLYNSDRLKFYIGDVRDSNSIVDAIKGSDYIFHAAALKQVPSCEFYPLEAVKTNIIGTSNVLNVASANGVKKVVVLSTDKACYPINAMGMTKALMEKIATAKAFSIGDSGMIICKTRYGNVMASRGSVIPVFKEQMLNGYDVTVTDGDMTRFMMTLDDAVDLVMYAFKYGKQGDLFVQKAPAATINTLVEAMANMLHVKPCVNVIGVRHGEKKYETLITKEEMSKSEDLGAYYRIPMDNGGLNYSNYKRDNCSEVEEFNSSNTTILDVAGMMTLLEKVGITNEE